MVSRVKCTKQVDWNKVYDMNYSATIETKLRSFQIKLNLRSIVTKIALCRFVLKMLNNCTFCHSSPETLMYLFCNRRNILGKCGLIYF